MEIAKLHMKLGDFRKCRIMCQQLMALPSSGGDVGEEADVAEISKLHDEVVALIERDGYVGLAAVGVIGIVIAGILFFTQRGRTKNKAAT